jgi:hypothetical protein
MNRRDIMTPKAIRETELGWELRNEAVDLLKGIVAEWDSDPMSVQCFDLRIVKRAKEVVKQLDKIHIL